MGASWGAWRCGGIVRAWVMMGASCVGRRDQANRASEAALIPMAVNPHIDTSTTGMVITAPACISLGCLLKLSRLANIARVASAAKANRVYSFMFVLRLGLYSVCGVGSDILLTSFWVSNG